MGYKLYIKRRHNLKLLVFNTVIFNSSELLQVGMGRAFFSSFSHRVREKGQRRGREEEGEGKEREGRGKGREPG